jgi:hypothetical protein
MLTGILSDDYIRKNCWPKTTLVPVLKNKPIKIKKAGNMRNDYQFPQQQAVIYDLAENILLSTPQKNRPVNSDIVSYVAEGLVKMEPMLTPIPMLTPVKLETPIKMEQIPVKWKPMKLERPMEPIPMEPIPMEPQISGRHLKAMHLSESARQIPVSESGRSSIFSVSRGAKRGLYEKIQDYPEAP